MSSSHRFEYDGGYEYSDVEDSPMTLHDDRMAVDSFDGKIELPPLRSMISSDRLGFEESSWTQRTPTLEPLPHGAAPRFPYDSAMIARLTTKI